ncbi:MAG: hypothetical protein KDJ65_21815 [Anaerolineae bacterium]|nr:hypothetical protein [Anaerolineae bacterium]
MAVKLCLDCDREVETGLYPKIGQRIKCSYCGVTMEIIGVDPLEFDWVYDGPAVNVDWGNTWWKMASSAADN